MGLVGFDEVAVEFFVGFVEFFFFVGSHRGLNLLDLEKLGIDVVVDLGEGVVIDVLLLLDGKVGAFDVSFVFVE